jgi:hypothetical protein
VADIKKRSKEGDDAAKAAAAAELKGALEELAAAKKAVEEAETRALAVCARTSLLSRIFCRSLSSFTRLRPSLESARREIKGWCMANNEHGGNEEVEQGGLKKLKFSYTPVARMQAKETR